MKIYIASDFKCHTEKLDDSYREIETDFFDGKCNEFIEGYLFIPNNEKWINEDGEEFYGEMMAPWKPYDELDGAQRVYEQRLLLEYETSLAELDILVLDTQYQNLIGGL